MTSQDQILRNHAQQIILVRIDSIITTIAIATMSALCTTIAKTTAINTGRPIYHWRDPPRNTRSLEAHTEIYRREVWTMQTMLMIKLAREGKLKI